MLKYFGGNITTKKHGGGQEIILDTNNKLTAKNYSVVGDFSSASLPTNWSLNPKGSLPLFAK